MFLSRPQRQNPLSKSPSSDRAKKSLKGSRVAKKINKIAPVSQTPPSSAESSSIAEVADPKQGQLLNILGSKKENRKGSEKVARLLLALGAEEAAAILKQFSPEEIESIMLQMSRIDHITTEEKRQILEEFEQHLREHRERISGGPEETRRFLQISLGEERAKQLLGKLDQQNLYQNFAFLEGMDASQLAAALAQEHAQVVAVALTFLKPRIAADIMGHLPEKFRLEVAVRIARTSQIHPEAVEQVARALREKFERRSKADAYSSIGGARSLAGILNQMDRHSEEQILKEVGDAMPNIMEEVKGYLYSFEELANLKNREVRLLVSQVDDDRQIAAALRGTTEQLRRHFFNAMSQNRAADIIEEMEQRGPLPVREVNDARAQILAVARLLDNEGSIVIKKEKEDYI